MIRPLAASAPATGAADTPDAETVRLQARVAELEQELAVYRGAMAARDISERRFQSLVENMRGILFYRSEPSGDVYMYGPDAQAIAGTLQADGRADIDLWYRSIHPDDLDAYLETERRRRETGEDFTIEFRYVHPRTGQLIWARERGYVVEGDDGKRFFDGYIIDITEAKLQEQRLLDATEAAVVANRSKSQFLANMSHELRTPLNAIIGFAEIIMSQSFGRLGSDKYVEYSTDIHTSATHLLRLIEDILDVSKAESGKAEVNESLLDLGYVINSAIRMVRDHAASKNLALSTEIDEWLPQLRADERKMRQVLINLLSNAVKFTPEGGSVVVRAFEREDGGITIAVTDTGIGMAEDDIPRAMEPFVQIHSGLGRSYEGTGLGLPLCAKLMDLHGGRLELDSRLGVGTEVRAVLPPDRSIRPFRNAGFQVPA